MVREENTTRDYSSLKADANAYRQQVRLAAVQIAGLRPEELEQALAYELEPSSGIPAAEAEVNYQPVADPDPTVRVFEVAVRRKKRRGAASGLDRWLKPAIALGVCVVLAVVADGVWLAHRKGVLAASVAERRPLQAELNRLNERTRAATAEAGRVRAAREAAVRAQDDVARRRVAHVDILGALAAVCGERAVLASLGSGEGGALVVRAIASSADAAAAVMRDLTVRAASCGWALVPGAIRASESGQTVQFDFALARGK